MHRDIGRNGGRRFFVNPGSAIAALLCAATVAAQSGETPLPPALGDTDWRLVQFQSMDDAVGTLTPEDPAHYTMRLGADGRVAMRLNCNRATGTWTAAAAADGGSGTFRFGPLATTRALCPPPSLDERIARDADYVRGYLLADGRLHLSLLADGGIYTWAPLVVPAAPAAGGPRHWTVADIAGRLNLRARPSVTADVVATFAPGAILSNLGCTTAEGRHWCDVQAMAGGPRGYVAAEFLRGTISPNGSVVTGEDDSALRAGRGDFDATGYIPCAQAAGQPMGQCEFGVARSGGGYATVVVKKPDGRTRALFFVLGRALSADSSEADGYPAFSATRTGDLHEIEVGPERYEVPDAVVLGG
ncbi:MAG: META domain-containing protein [Gammaproteobacteria bacterium]